ncbi:hypothetical protein BJ546DRAFT_1013142 [Cryomyces antarcticus]
MLHTISVVDTDLCNCGQRETVRHFLIECIRWQIERRELRQLAGGRWGDLFYLLGGWLGRQLPSGRFIDGDLDSWKPNTSIVAATIAFAKRTERLQATEP